MASRVGDKIKLTSIDELLCVPETNGTTEIELGLISAFENHPFRVVDDEKMEELVESIRQQGILSPVLVRPDDEGGYEMISGHRRLHAAKIVGLKKIPAIVRELTDDEAIIAMVNANLQREEVLPSERGFSLKMKMDALRHQGACRHDVAKLSPLERKTATIVGEGSGLTGRSVQRYIRLTELIPELLDMVDTKRLSLVNGVDISYFDKSVRGLLQSCWKNGKQNRRLEMMLNYYRKSEAGQYSFIRIPKVLMTEEPFDSLSLQSKLLYGMLIDRMSAAGKNQWIDEENRVYIVYPIQEIQKDMKVSKHKAIDCLAELEQIGLVEKRLKGNGRPTHLYVKNFVSAPV